MGDCGEIFLCLSLNVLPCHQCHQLIVSCSIACEHNDPCGNFETFFTHSRHTASNSFSLGQLKKTTTVKLVAPESRPNLSRSLAQAHASSRTITLTCRAVFAASTAYSTILFTDYIYRNLLCGPDIGTSKDVLNSFPNQLGYHMHILKVELKVLEAPLLSIACTIRIYVVETGHFRQCVPRVSTAPLP